MYTYIYIYIYMYILLMIMFILIGDVGGGVRRRRSARGPGEPRRAGVRSQGACSILMGILGAPYF